MKLLERGLVYDASQAPTQRRCAAFCGLTRLADGSLLCSFKVGPQKVSARDNVHIARSTDEGRTWRLVCEGIPAEWEGTPGSFTSAYVFEHDHGTLSISCVWVDRTHPELPLANPETTGLLPIKHLMGQSTDGGRTWAPLREVSLKPNPGATITNEIIRLDSGNLLLPYESWKEWNDRDGIQRANVRISADDGVTWSSPHTMASDPEQRLYYWDNRVTKHVETGRVVGLFWTHNSKSATDTDIHMAWSDPDGTNWSQPQSTGIAGQIAAPLFLDATHLLCTYVHRHDPPSIRAVLSPDMGSTWDMDDELLVYASGGGTEAGTTGPRYDADYWEDMVRWTFGHPKAIRLADGSVLAVYYAGTPDALSIHWARLAPFEH